MTTKLSNEKPGRLRRRGVVRAILGIGIILGLGGVNTLALWTDTATMNTGTITSGSLDMTLQGNLTGPGGTWNNTSFTFTNMIPGESYAVTIPVQRAANTAPFSYTMTGAMTGALAQHVRWNVVSGSANTQTVSSTGIRTQACTGTSVVSNVTLSSTQANVIGTPRPIAGSTYSESLCLRVELPASAGNTAQSLTGSATFVFNATQITS